MARKGDAKSQGGTHGQGDQPDPNLALVEIPEEGDGAELSPEEVDGRISRGEKEKNSASTHQGPGDQEEHGLADEETPEDDQNQE